MQRLALGKTVTLSQGSGARASRALISALILKYFKSKTLAQLDDASEVQTKTTRLAFSTDSYVVSPLFFPGGDIGHISICGTVNDLAMKGAIPKYISVAFIIEEGLEIKVLERVLKSMSRAAQKAGVEIVTGDTKVVPRGTCDKLFINTSGIGEIIKGSKISSQNIKKGDAIIVSGPVGEHGLCIMNERHELGFKGLKSDGAPLNKAAAQLAPFAHCMRDLTRGGLASALKELAESSKVNMEIEEEKIPLTQAVRAASKIFGVNPIFSANEGKLVCFVSQNKVKQALKILGKHAAVIGKVTDKGSEVYIRTAIIKRKLTEEESELLPRVC